MAETENQQIAGVVITPLIRHLDARGWLMEVWRNDELPVRFNPAMGYVSLTRPGVVRGPHEHVEQSDFFVFVSGEFRLYLWDRDGRKMELEVGERNPVSVLVPPGVIHAYQNIGLSVATVMNFPNRLYGGWKRSEAVDEIRHEDDAGSRFALTLDRRIDDDPVRELMLDYARSREGKTLEAVYGKQG